ncbi:MAG: hypothetical protein LBQ66_04035 [Planctomycetaceae bacterium]|nr:hypothetical protein [Planctomycetaceae bacterium]
MGVLVLPIRFPPPLFSSCSARRKRNRPAVGYPPYDHRPAVGCLPYDHQRGNHSISFILHFSSGSNLKKWASEVETLPVIPNVSG